MSNTAGTARRDAMDSKTWSTAEQLRAAGAAALSDAAADARDTLAEGYRETAKRAEAAYEAATDGISDGYHEAEAGAKAAAQTIESGTREAGEAIAQFGREHPLMLAAMGFAAGLLIGSILPKR